MSLVNCCGEMNVLWWVGLLFSWCINAEKCTQIHNIISYGIYSPLMVVMSISSPTYKNVVTQFLAGNFYCKFGIYNAKSLFCQNIVPLGQSEAEILIDLCSIKRSYVSGPIKRSYVTEWSVLCTYTTMIFVWVYYTKKYISKHLASVHHK